MSRNGSLKLVGVAFGLAALALSDVASAGIGPPPNARPGECWGQVSNPVTYETTSERVLVSAARTETRGAAAVVKRTARRVLVSPEHTIQVPTPGTYREEVSYAMRPAAVRIVRTPATYRVEKESVLVEAGHAEWKKADAATIARGEAVPGQVVVRPTGEVMCRIWIPDRYAIQEKKVQVTQGTETRTVVAAHKVRIVKRILVKAGAPVAKVVPAVYRNEWTTTVVKASTARTVQVAAVYRTVEHRGAHGGGVSWAQVFCGGPLVPGFIQRVQIALNARGLDAGPPDGYPRPEMYAALNRFQASRGLGQGQLTIESARALGVW